MPRIGRTSKRQREHLIRHCCNPRGMPNSRTIRAIYGQSSTGRTRPTTGVVRQSSADCRTVLSVTDPFATDQQVGLSVSDPVAADWRTSLTVPYPLARASLSLFNLCAADFQARISGPNPVASG
jgi:hypothetical protein